MSRHRQQNPCAAARRPLWKAGAACRWSTVIADDKYIRDFILLPRSQIAAGYDPVMPSFEGKVSEDQLLRLVVYIKSLAGRQP